MEEQVIYEGPVGNRPFKMKVVSVGENMWRGVLKISNSEDEVVYEREVSINRRNPVGGEEAHVREWQKVVNTWVHNNG